MTKDHLKLIADTVEAMRPMLANLPPDVQGAILNELIAIWLAGFNVEGNSAATRELRNKLLEMQITAILNLTDIYDNEAVTIN